MRAAVFAEHGGPEVLCVEETPQPVLKPDEALIKVEAAALNRLDLAARAGRPEVEPMPHIGGLDVVGTVAETGADVQNVQPGDRVAVYPILSCRNCGLCASGDSALCPRQRVYGFQTQGGFAEYCAAPAVNLERVSPLADAAETAALPTAYLTAWRMLVRNARLKRGERVLIHSIGGGVGMAALDIARYLGARVIGTAGADAKIETALNAGAEAVVNYRKESAAERVMQFTEGEGCDVVVDVIGEATWEISLQCAAVNGRIVTAGVTSGSVAPTNIRHFYQRQLTAMGSVVGGQAEFRTLLALASSGFLRPVVARRFALDEIRAAHEALESRACVGKVVIEP